MSWFDIIVLVLMGAGAVFGFLRGFVQEVLSLIAWGLIILGVRFLHGPATEFLIEPIGSEGGAAVLAFLSVVIVTFALGRWIARSIGRKSRQSVLGPIDRVLGFGFGLLKGLIGATLIYLLIVMVIDTIYGGASARPEWLTQSRTYPLVNASGEAMSAFVKERREQTPEPS